MAWIAHTFQTGLLPAEVWTIITWIAFFFKLASIAFAVPVLGLVVFDFCLWIWRMNQPHPQDHVLRPNRLSPKATEQMSNLTLSSNGTGSTTAHSARTTASQRRTVYSGHTE
ncbi:hypothetical protein F4819DRAFT_485361 [Hypoxylon fuscum]|nr:hypothetical protein F4819DRAFT_485361 [Hypoxylon fuscum]